MSPDTSSIDDGRDGTDETPPFEGETDRVALVAELERLRAETERLRTSYVRARRSEYRRTAMGFAAFGLLATLGAVLFPATRTVLLALGGTGMFAAVLTRFITPERFLSAGVGDAVYDTLARNGDRLCRELALADQRVYVPTDSSATDARLFVPQRTDFGVPDADALEPLFVVTGDESTRGVSLRPTGESLFAEFEAALDGPLEDDPAALVTQVRESIVEQFELADRVEYALDADAGRLSIRASGGPYDDLDRFDNPVVSTVGVALACGLDRPVRRDVSGRSDESVALLRWEPPAEDPTGSD